MPMRNIAKSYNVTLGSVEAMLAGLEHRGLFVAEDDDRILYAMMDEPDVPFNKDRDYYRNRIR